MYKVCISGKLVDPLVEGGKGIGASDGLSSGSWAACGGAGTFSGVAAQDYDENGNIKRLVFNEETRDKRHLELIQQSINGCIEQAKIAYDTAMGNGVIQMNVLWEAGGIPQILHGFLEKAAHFIDGIVCGAGLPFDLAAIATKYKVYYNPIVSSALAFAVLWKRAYSKASDLLGSVIYEDPWVAGGHNGITSREDPDKPERPYERLLSLRKLMNSFGLNNMTIVIAGGVWTLTEWSEYIDNAELQPLAFQFGTRPLLTQESPIPMIWKNRLFDLTPDSVKLHRFSPTGFYSSAVNNSFLQELFRRSERQIKFSDTNIDEFTQPLKMGRRTIFIEPQNLSKAEEWQRQGYIDIMKTPDDTIIFVDPDSRKQILEDQRNCMGCLSKCRFSNWDERKGNTGFTPDPRSFCILKTLDDIVHGGSIENNLMFAGKNVYRFSQDEFYKNRRIPTVKELYTKIKEEIGWINEN